MNDKKIGISLKYKLLLLLTIIPVVSLAIYIVLATDLFGRDKIAYVKDSSVAVAKSLSVQLRLEVTGYLDKIRPIAESFDFNEQKFSSASLDFFNSQDRIDGLILVQRSANGEYVTLADLTKNNDFGAHFKVDSTLLNRIRERVLREQIVVEGSPHSDIHIIIGAVIGDPGAVNHSILIGLYRASDLSSAFAKSQIYDHFLLDKNGQVLLGPQGKSIDFDSVKQIMSLKQPDGALESASEKPLIVSYSKTNLAGMVVTAIVSRQAALSAVNVLLVQSLLFFVALIATTVIVSLIASVKLTSSLRELYEATKKIAKGDFAVRVKSTSNDEVGGLSEGFNFMAAEVSRLMAETSEKVRMEGELQTVKLVQETLFPGDENKFGPFDVIGYFEPASECGGDWWSYSRVGDKLYLWIGDATGHGAPAAMVTSAAKSAVTVIEDLPAMTPGKALEIMNKAIHETSKGRILMTFFVACIDLKLGELVYANASHEPPYLIHLRDPSHKFTKKDLEPLIESNGPRLGDKREASYPECRVQLRKGDLLLFYTDGIVDLKSPDGKSWGERGFIRSICDSVTRESDVQSRVAALKTTIQNYRGDSVLVDDITLLACQYGEAA